MALTMRQIALEVTRINTSIRINEPASSLLLVLMKLSDIRLPRIFVKKMAVTMPAPFFPLPLILLLLPIKHSIAMLLVSRPLSIIEHLPLVIVVHTLNLLHSVNEQAIIYLATVKDVDPLSMKNVLPPTPVVIISNGILEPALALSLLVTVDLTHVLALGEGCLDGIRQVFESLYEGVHLDLVVFLDGLISRVAAGYIEGSHIVLVVIIRNRSSQRHGLVESSSSK